MIYVLTLTWNGLDKLQRLKDGLIKNLTHCNQSAVWCIRDNGSVDGTKEWLESWDETVGLDTLLVDHNRANFAQGVNSLFNKISFKEGEENFVLLLNNDIEFADDTSLANMMDLMKDPKVGMVGARLLYSGTNKLQHAGVIFGPKYGNMPYHFRHKEESDQHAEKNRYFQAVTAACCFIRQGAFQAMDEKYFWAFEDIDLSLRIGAAGWKVAYCGQTKIYHEESASLKINPINKMFLSPNVKHFKSLWLGKYAHDHETYLTNKNYNIIQ
ncbi:MAG: glycosyltransferase [bacterium]|nr:glycosyltransferase [bacterium]